LFALSRKINLKVNNFIDTYLFIEYNIEKYSIGLQREDKPQMIIVEGQQLLTSQMTAVLKPYIGEAHLISSVLVLTHLMGLKEFSFFGDEKTYLKLKKLLFPNVYIHFCMDSFEIAFVDVTAMKKNFLNLFLFRNWVETLKFGKKVLLYDVLKEGNSVFELCEYILLNHQMYICEKEKL